MRQICFIYFALSLFSCLNASSNLSVPRYFSQSTEWEDEQGNRIDLSVYKNRPVVLTMMYSECRKTCAHLTVNKLKEIESIFSQAKIDAEFIIATFDPQNDTPEVLKRYKDRIAPQNSHWHFIRAGESQTRQFASRLGLGGYWEMDGHIQHSFRIVFWNPSIGQERFVDLENQDVKVRFLLQ